MPTEGIPERRSWSGRALLRGAIVLAGVVLAGAGGYLHFTLAAQTRAGRCDGCEPWHPLLVLAPLVLGCALVLAGGYLQYRR